MVTAEAVHQSLTVTLAKILVTRTKRKIVLAQSVKNQKVAKKVVRLAKILAIKILTTVRTCNQLILQIQTRNRALIE